MKVWISILFIVFSVAAIAEEVFYEIPIKELKITEGQIEHAPFYEIPEAIVRLDGDGEGYYIADHWSYPGNTHKESLVVRVSKTRDVTGWLAIMPTDWNKGVYSARFEIPSGQASEKARDAFYGAKAEYYDRLVQRGVAGGAWFRHEADRVREVLGKKAAENAPGPRGPRRQMQLDDTYELFSGGRAISENLQLDRALLSSPQDKNALKPVDLASVPGVTIKEINWKPLLKDDQPVLDPLAATIPADQHALFFPSFKAMMDLADEANGGATPVLHLLEPRGEDAHSKERYQRQLCLAPTEAARVLGPFVVNSVAVTGSDPYLRTGTDIAVIFDAKNVALLKTFLAAKHTAAVQENPIAQAVSGEVAGVAYSGVVSPDRSICSYLAATGNTVVVTNSLYQLTRIIETGSGKGTAMQSLPEYSFFRQRYVRGDKEESCFLVMTDAAIRRWCGARWRIGNSRRTQAMAALAELQARYLDALAAGSVKEGVLESEFSGLGTVTLTDRGVRSSIYNTMEFMTPIAELDLAQGTQGEVDAYNRWRDRYQSNWNWSFDPIAIRTFVNPDGKINADMTITPLIARSEYNFLIELTKNGSISPDAGDRHAESMLELTLGITTDRSKPGWISAETLNWLGSTVSVFFDEDPLWAEIAAARSDPAKLQNLSARTPVGILVDVKKAVGLDNVITRLMAMENVTKENRVHSGEAYVEVSFPGRYILGNERQLIYCTTTADSELVTPNEDVMKRALERRAKRKANAELPPQPVWLGKNVGMQADVRLIRTAELFEDYYSKELQTHSWSNIYILNEWKKRYPKDDPVKLHQKFWQTELLCPGGGTYVWNEKWQTMESTVFGHPGEPKKPEHVLSETLGRIKSGNFGLTFENDGLRARVEIERKAGAEKGNAQKAP